jgi:hypothetical protein
MATPRRLGVLFLAGAAGCSGGSSGKATSASDAAVDASPDAGDFDSGDCFPFCAGDASLPVEEAGGDAAMTCAQLKAAYEAFELTAKACDPQLPNQCFATADGPCCPVTVSSSQDAVNAFEDAVTSYQQQCTPECSNFICPSAPSGQCTATGTATGICM